MTEKTALWACARCERRKKIENVQTDPVVLRVCDYCKIENWVRPVGHAGADTLNPKQVLPPEKVAVHAEMVEEAKELEEAPLEEASLGPKEESEPEKSDKEKEIEALKAKLAELEGY